jgi:hypothetical protein
VARNLGRKLGWPGSPTEMAAFREVGNLTREDLLVLAAVRSLRPARRPAAPSLPRVGSSQRCDGRWGPVGQSAAGSW